MADDTLGALRRAGLERTQTLQARPNSVEGCAFLAQQAVAADRAGREVDALQLYQRTCAGLDQLAVSGDPRAQSQRDTYLPRLSELALKLKCRAIDVWDDVRWSFVVCLFVCCWCCLLVLLHSSSSSSFFFCGAFVLFR
jgi:hypothetical protein